MGTIPVSNGFPRALYLWHRFSRVIFFVKIYLVSEQVIQTENRSKSLSVTQHLTSVTAMLPLIINSN